MSNHRREVKKGLPAESQVRIPAGDDRLAGMLHEADAGMTDEAVVVCPPFGDERKSAWRALTHLARILASGGYPVVQFDYWGCGESAGDFLDASLSTRLRDISAAADYLRRTTGADRLGLLGLRLGATLATRVAAERTDCTTMVLLEPIVEIAKYFDRMMQRKKIRQMITAGKAQGGETGTDIVDLDGYAMRRATLEELQQLRFGAGKTGCERRTLLVQISFNETLRSNVEQASGILRDQEGREPQVEKLVMPPFWSRVDVTDTGELNAVVKSFMVGDDGRD